ncbi:MAG: hypothetical protein O9302_09690 [Cyclobacteriaceae bacterium]|jgi:hypothetical protein|nr:hypothetical protein [Flammeovirgaceae bacterium]MCZ8021799.1 hypothetical protein [Cytophagales bacterium]MCZ8328318.1 hypothetical protein [Cyclobacteriaceae bacterium]
MKIVFKLMVSVVSLLFFTSCTSDSVEEAFDCNKSDLSIALSSSTSLTSCSVTDGVISVQASGGASPYQYRINGGTFGSSATFNNLAAGTYTVEVKDANGCVKVLSPSPTLTNANSTLAVSNVAKVNDTQCIGGNGSITVTVNGGISPYTFKIGSGSFVTNNVFSNLESGNYTVTVKDADNCQVTTNQEVARGATGLSYDGEIKNIINASCNLTQCHGGGREPNLTTYASVFANRAKVKSELASNRMPDPPGTITAENRQKIICWIDDGAPSN